MPSLILRLEQLSLPSAVVPQPGPAVDSAVSAVMLDVDAPPAPVVDDEVPELTDTRTAPHGIGTARQVLHLPVAEPRPAGEPSGSPSTLSRWTLAVAAAADGCLLVDTDGILLSISVAAVALLGSGDAVVVGRHLLDVLRLVDFETGADRPEYAPRVTPLVVLDGPGLARSMMRVRHETGVTVTLDSSSAPIHDSTGELLGSITFLAPIPSR